MLLVESVVEESGLRYFRNHGPWNGCPAELFRFSAFQNLSVSAFSPGGIASALSEKSAVKTGAAARLFRWTVSQEAAEAAEAHQPAFQQESNRREH